ncbi:MAG: DoxX family protein [Bacteriovoracaceae bacterium]|nr:DoxX family protein [Bacteriovoracaceae bacterium]
MSYNPNFSPIILFLSLFSSLSFIVYGLLCLFTQHMHMEFQRYGLSKFRKLTGALELLGGLGILVGVKFQILYVFSLSTIGLTLLMFLGIMARIKIHDKFVAILPALFYFFLNLYLFINYLEIL